MNYEKYTELFVSSDFLEYEFKSVGPKGSILKIIRFTTSSNDEAIFDLALGNKMADGNLDDLARDNNKDRNKILATVVAVLKVFFDQYPDKWVFFRGSTPERTRLYRMAITLNLEELNTDFEIVGALTENSSYKDVSFQKGINYYGFYVQGKRRNFRREYKISLYEENRSTESRD
ncbi:hypothetical protein A4H97_25825 [Niastella yeongjuensis]|uniref:Uncharacterized protein n=1 Tax=Niastella yeongjuensis TaxID=354355 RepID=A0A1V9F1C3_9BACT|nr:hypothetical protein [Niastella yeongjuensis]OQP52036.1 hypothetical protein A4H97_25825 [Niastella yeongjuensis]SEP36797.1 hypothetical protein SAMN05660816_05509 [Niastella yeongjuensis]